MASESKKKSGGESHRKEREVKVMQEMIDEKTLAQLQKQLAAEKRHGKRSSKEKRY